MVITCHLSLQINPIGLLASVSSLAYLHLRNHSSPPLFFPGWFYFWMAAGLAWLNTALRPGGGGKTWESLLIFSPVAGKTCLSCCGWNISVYLWLHVGQQSIHTGLERWHYCPLPPKSDAFLAKAPVTRGNPGQMAENKQKSSVTISWCTTFLLLAAGALAQGSVRQILLSESSTAVMKPTEFLQVMLRCPRSKQQKWSLKQLRKASKTNKSS